MTNAGADKSYQTQAPLECYLFPASGHHQDPLPPITLSHLGIFGTVTEGKQSSFQD